MGGVTNIALDLDEPNALASVGWVVRRLTGGTGPMADFLDRRDPENIVDNAERLKDCAGATRSAELKPQGESIL